jgi:Peptide-N-glycosidase F, C terminal/Secretion system C-terminal sorting domain
VTDYAFLLHDSVQIRSLYEGYSQGSLYTLSFDLIEGTPPTDAYDLKVLAFGDFPYGSASNPISNYFPPWRIALDSTADITTLRLITTGHGGDANDADEFTPHTNAIWVNGAHAYDQFLWRSDCGQNPVWPQTGTWYYQRSGWCPGDKVNYWDYDLTTFGTKGDSITVQYKVDPYTSPNGGPYIITSIQQISKHGPNFQNDVRLEDVLVPNNAQEFNRMNPICEEGIPFIVIRNTGGKVLTPASVQYGHDSTIQNTYQWTGSLNFMDTAQVFLPPVDLGDSGTHPFTVIVGLPNGQPDEYTRGDTITTSYVLPKSYANTIYIAVKTDSLGYGIPNGISYQIEDVNGNFYLYNGNIEDKTLTRDTVTLPNGCYQFTIFDSSQGIGLYPIIPGSVAGSYSLIDSKKKTILSATTSNLLASFGNQQITTFNAGGAPSSVSEYIQPSAFDFSIWPNPASTDISLDLSSLSGIATPATIQIFDVLGHSLVTRIVNPSDFASATMNIGSLADGSYIVLVRAFGVRASQRFVVKH